MTTPLTPSISRDFVVQQWLLEHATTYQLQPDTCVPASSDASFRRYFRVQAEQGPLIVMDAPPDLEDCTPFLQVQRLFHATGVPVPAVLASDLNAGILLLEDLGDTPYLQVLNLEAPDAHTKTEIPTPRQLYADATQVLVTLQCGTRADALPPYSASLLQREMELFRDWYCGTHVQLQLSQQEHQALDQIFALLTARALSQAQVYVHRDYHSRNLMYCPDKDEPTAHASPGQRNPGVIDFQDAVIGAITYDLVSLLRDAYIDWPEAQQIDFAIRYWEQARRQNLPVPADFADFYSDFEWMGLQRHLKVLGIFARLWHRDGKSAYLQHLPRVQKYVRQCAQRYSAFTPLLHLLDRIEQRATVIQYTF